jgi:hypothetical protein
VAKAGLILWNLAAPLAAAPFKTVYKTCIFPQAVKALRCPKASFSADCKAVIQNKPAIAAEALRHPKSEAESTVQAGLLVRGCDGGLGEFLALGIGLFGGLAGFERDIA